MMNDHIEHLKALLADFEQVLSAAVIEELSRIGRPVHIADFSYNPFSEDVACYMDSIGLDGKREIVLQTSFNDVKEKSLDEIIADSEIDHWSLIGLLEVLSDIASGTKDSS